MTRSSRGCCGRDSMVVEFINIVVALLPRTGNTLTNTLASSQCSNLLSQRSTSLTQPIKAGFISSPLPVPQHDNTLERILDILVLGPGHFGTDLDISVLGTGQFGTWMRQYSLLTTIVWYLLIVNIFVLVVL